MEIGKEVEQKVLAYEVHVAGVFGRNRKAKRELFKLAEVPEAEPLTLETAKELMVKKMAEVKPKPGAVLRLLKTPQTVALREIDGIQYKTTCFAAFSHEVIHQETVA